MQYKHLCREIGLAYGVDAHFQKLPRTVSWNKPPEGSVCLNVDGSAVSNQGRAGFVGLFHDNMCKLFLAFMVLWAILILCKLR